MANISMYKDNPCKGEKVHIDLWITVQSDKTSLTKDTKEKKIVIINGGLDNKIYNILTDDILSAYNEIVQNSKVKKHTKLYDEDYLDYLRNQKPNDPDVKRMRIMMMTEGGVYPNPFTLQMYHWKINDNYKKEFDKQVVSEYSTSTTSYYREITQSKIPTKIDNTGFCSHLIFNNSCGQYNDCGSNLMCIENKCQCAHKYLRPIDKGSFCEFLPLSIDKTFDNNYIRNYVTYQRRYRKFVPDIVCKRQCDKNNHCPNEMICFKKICENKNEIDTVLWTRFIANGEKEIKMHINKEYCQVSEDCDFNFICKHNSCQCPDDLYTIKNGTICAQLHLIKFKNESDVNTGFIIKNDILRKTLPLYICKQHCITATDCPMNMYCENASCLYDKDTDSNIWTDFKQIPANTVPGRGYNEPCEELIECNNNLICRHNLCQCPDDLYPIKNRTICAQLHLTKFKNESDVNTGFIIKNDLLRKTLPLYICKQHCITATDCPMNMYCENASCLYDKDPDYNIWTDFEQIPANTVPGRGYNEPCEELIECNNNFICRNNLCQCPDDLYPIKNGTICAQLHLTKFKNESDVNTGFIIKNDRLRKTLPLYICKQHCITATDCPMNMYCENASCLYDKDPDYNIWTDFKQIPANTVPGRGYNEPCEELIECNNNFICRNNLCQCPDDLYPIKNGTICAQLHLTKFKNESDVNTGFIIKNDRLRKTLPLYICKQHCITATDCPMNMYCENASCLYDKDTDSNIWTDFKQIPANTVPGRGYNEPCEELIECNNNFICKHNSCQCPDDLYPINNGTICVQLHLTKFKNESDVNTGFIIKNDLLRKSLPLYICKQHCITATDCPMNMYCENASCLYDKDPDSNIWTDFEQILANTVPGRGYNEPCEELIECSNNFICKHNSCQCPDDLYPIKNGSICTQLHLIKFKNESDVNTGFIIKNDILRKTLPLYICKQHCITATDCPMNMYCENASCLYDKDTDSNIWTDFKQIPANTVPGRGYNEPCEELIECNNNFICRHNLCQCPDDLYPIKNGTICAQLHLTKFKNESDVNTGFIIKNDLLRKTLPLYICKQHCITATDCPMNMYCENASCLYDKDPDYNIWTYFKQIPANTVPGRGYNEPCEELIECNNNFICRHNLCQCPDDLYPIKNGTICAHLHFTKFKNESDVNTGFIIKNNILRKTLPLYICKQQCITATDCPMNMYCVNASCLYDKDPDSNIWTDFEQIPANTVPGRGYNEPCEELIECSNNFICKHNSCKCPDDYYPIKNGTICAQLYLTEFKNERELNPGHIISENYIRKSLPNYICKVQCYTDIDCSTGMFCGHNMTCTYYPGSHYCIDNVSCSNNMICVNYSCYTNLNISDSFIDLHGYNLSNSIMYSAFWKKYRYLWVLLFLSIMTIIIWQMFLLRYISLANFLTNIQIVDDFLADFRYGQSDSDDTDYDSEFSDISEDEFPHKRNFQFSTFTD
ncbi:hypothetical protein GJ496_010302 [Pomphorhynchus laevis]|nr:hypothetical protein GJ496_010302 [Pomphorhynchus laevis]